MLKNFISPENAGETHYLWRKTATYYIGSGKEIKGSNTEDRIT